MKKGFTLVELLGVIVILLVMILVAIPAVNKVINTGEETVYDIQVNRILNAAYDYSIENTTILPTRDEKYYVTISELVYNGFLDRLINPNTGEYFPDEYLVSIENVGKNYRNTSRYSKKTGDYLYKIEYDEMSEQEYNTNKPKVYLESMITGDRVLDSYTEVINQNDVFNENSNYVIKVYDKDNTDITEDVKMIKTILFNDILVDSVDTRKIGIYKIVYVAILKEDGKAYASKFTWNIIIRDTEVPVLTIPTNNNISTSITTFDLMEGVSCTDNSDNCNITYSGEIKFGTSGVYTITYTAVDDAGNRSTRERIITIE